MLLAWLQCGDASRVCGIKVCEATMRLSVVESVLARIGFTYVFVDGCVVGDGGGDASVCLVFTTDKTMVNNPHAAACTRHNAVVYDDADLHGMVTRVVELLAGDAVQSDWDMCYFELVDRSTGYPTWCARQRMYRNNDCDVQYVGTDDNDGAGIGVDLMIAASVYIAVAAIFITKYAWSVYFDTTH